MIEAATADRTAIEDALRLRIGEARPISASDRARKPRRGELFAYVRVEPGRTADARVVRLVLSDARAYVRPIESPPELRARELAATVANLVAGIEEDDILPDERNVPLPPALAPAAAPPPKPVAPLPVVLPPPRLELGFAGGGDVVLAVGAPSPQGFAAAGGHARFDARWRDGGLVALALRGSGHRKRGYGLTRIRLAIEGGYAWRRGSFELLASAGATIEPWLVTRGGVIPRVADRRPAHVAVGGLVRLAPSWRRRTSGQRSVRLSPFVELAGAAVPIAGGGVGRVRIDDGTVRDLFRIGGFELVLGLELGGWWPSVER